ncbi:tetrahydrofolate dehydrogenase/cyclohydrolase catalytic domain-containing protein [Mesorhizobium sp. M0491]|uniref:tetrahydrofolate dehydrogenase/cyclohydrolase catalytic domain-containing protein n=1 Tax=Mesorhizobium sp. M0491 TaxID=2956950 RepID=UPI003335AFA4
MSAHLIDGKAFAARLREKVAASVAILKAEQGIVPGLAVVLVGNDLASAVYVRNKGVQTVAAGMASFEHKLPAEAAEVELLALIAQLNADPAVHVILVQLPLPRISMPMRSSTRSIPPRISTASTSPMSASWQPASAR